MARTADRRTFVRSAAAFRDTFLAGGLPSPGNILNAGPISETVCLHAVALRAARQKTGVRIYPSAVKLVYDSASMKITNVARANQYLSRHYRPGWEL